MRKKPRTNARILLVDIETAPATAYIWSLYDNYVPLDRIVKPGYTLCFAAQWYGEKDKMFFSVQEHGMKGMLSAAHALMDEADIIIHYNGKKFDIPTLSRELLIHGYLPPSDFKQIDLLAVVRRQFRFQSNKLDFVAQQLGIGNKVKHKGMELWKECMEGDERAWKTMRRYNLQDTALLTKLYERLRPWVPTHPNLGLYVDDPDKPTCPHCGSTNVKKDGTRKTQTRAYQRYKCLDCGTYSRGRRSLYTPAEGVLVPGHPR